MVAIQRYLRCHAAEDDQQSQVPLYRMGSVHLSGNGSHVFPYVWWDIDFKCILCDLPLDFVGYHCFGCQRSVWTQLVPVVVFLVNQDVLSHMKLVLCPFPVPVVC